MDLIDSHAHLDMPDFDPDREDVLKRSEAAGVAGLLCPVDLTRPESLAAASAMKAARSYILLAAGVHPHQAGIFNDGHLARIRDLAASGAIRAVGEIGLDYFYDFSTPAAQRPVLAAQVGLARELGLPVIIHSRLAGQDVIDILESEGFDRGGIIHCYTEDTATAGRLLDLGFHISFSGILTYTKAENVREAARYVPADRLLIETDSPYLVPAPLRSRWKRNEPAFVAETAARLAETRGETLESAAAAVKANFRRLFPV